MSAISDRYHEVLTRVTAAARRAGRDPGSITVVAAAKTFSADAIRELATAGGRDVGENYVQEAKRKIAETSDVALRWHCIGRIQRNKAAAAVELFGLIHTLDRIDLATELDRAAVRRGVRARCLIEVNVGGEASKAGVAPEELPRLVDACGRLSSLQVDGLMTIPPAGSLDEARRDFARLRVLGESLSRLRPPNVQFKELSMGMSADFEAAIAEGATMVRIGTSIFGARVRA